MNLFSIACGHLNRAASLEYRVGGILYFINSLTEIALVFVLRKAATKAATSVEVIKNVSDSIIVINQKGIVQSFNPAAENLFGYPAVEVVGRNVTMLMPDPYRTAHDEHLQRYLHTGKARVIGIVGRKISGLRKDSSTFPMELSVSEFRTNGERYFTGIIRDITERQQLEQQLRDADRKKDEFLAMLAHELRSPLAPLVTSLDLLAMETEPEQQQFALETMRNQTTHMVRLIDDLLDVSRMIRNKIQIKKELMTLAEVVAHAVEVTKPLFDSQRQEVTVLIPTQPIYLEADLTRLAQVIGNLLNNSSKYTDYGGRIWLIGEQTANEVMIKVKDTGIGISPDILPYIFDLFTQADQSLDRSKGGLGIGLSLVKNLVEMHDGRVEAKSAGLGKGSEFIVYLPAVSPVDFKKAASADESAKAEIVTGLKVLVVDDNTYAARGMALIIEKLGCKVQIAHDGLSACAAADNFKPDVIFLDIGLPGMNGYEVSRRLRQNPTFQDTIIIAITGYGREEDRMQSKAAGINEHFVKPISAIALRKWFAAINHNCSAN